jgi:hypothetical protein
VLRALNWNFPTPSGQLQELRKVPPLPSFGVQPRDDTGKFFPNTLVLRAVYQSINSKTAVSSFVSFQRWQSLF